MPALRPTVYGVPLGVVPAGPGAVTGGGVVPVPGVTPMFRLFAIELAHQITAAITTIAKSTHGQTAFAPLSTRTVSVSILVAISYSSIRTHCKHGRIVRFLCSYGSRC